MKKARSTEHRRAETSRRREWRWSEVLKAGEGLAGGDLVLIFNSSASTAVCFPLCFLWFFFLTKHWCFMQFSMVHDFAQFLNISEKGENNEWVVGQVQCGH